MKALYETLNFIKDTSSIGVWAIVFFLWKLDRRVYRLELVARVHNALPDERRETEGTNL